MIIFVGYLIFALYIANAGLGIITLPSFFLNINKWIFLIAGVLLVLAGFKHFKSNNY